MKEKRDEKNNKTERKQELKKAAEKSEEMEGVGVYFKDEKERRTENGGKGEM